jgi:glutamyl-tRNA synthetase
MSKRREEAAVEAFRERGFLPEAYANYLSTLGRGAPDGVEVRPISEIVELFSLEHVSKAPAMFDLKKLEHFNGEHIRGLSVDEFIERSAAHVAEAIAPLAPLVQERVRTLAEVTPMIDFLLVAPSYELTSWEKVMVKDADLARTMLDVALARFAELESWDARSINDAIIGYADEHEISRKKAQAPLRVAVTGRSVGPPLWESLEVLGREVTIERLRAVRERLSTT